MAKSSISGKRALIDHANSSVVIFTSIAAFIFVFSAIATKTLVAQANYQNKVITEKRKTLTQLKSNITAADQLADSYKKFTSSSQNAIGGQTTGTGPQGGDNTKIVLDALPSAYDFPALVNSLNALVSNKGVTISSISGTDDEVSQSTNQTSTSPEPVSIPFSIAAEGDYLKIQDYVKVFERSIRPIKIQTMNISGSQSSLNVSVTAETYYQPGKSLNFSSKVVK